MENNNKNKNEKLLKTEKVIIIEDITDKYANEIKLLPELDNEISLIEQIKDIVTTIYNTEIYRIDRINKMLSNNDYKNDKYNNESQRLKILKSLVNSDSFIYNNDGGKTKNKKQRKTKKNKEK